MNNCDISYEFIYENFRKTTVSGKCVIYGNRAETPDGVVFTDSVRADSVANTVGWHVLQPQVLGLPQIEGGNEGKIRKIENIRNDIKNNIFIRDNHYCWDYDIIKRLEPITSIYTNNPIFFCNYFCCAWGHVICYFPLQLYIYTELRKQIPGLIFMYSKVEHHPLVDDLLDLFEITDTLIIDTNYKLVNSGITIFAGQLTSNMSDMGIRFYRDIVVTKTTQKYRINMDSYPKKILFLRNPGNIDTLRYLINRQEIVDLCAKYGYVDVDQTKLAPQEYIQLASNASHIVQESGGSVCHLLWTKDTIKSIVFEYSNVPCNVYATYQDYACDYIKVISNNCLSDIVKYKNTKMVYNDMQYITTGIKDPNKIDNFFSAIAELEDAILSNEV